MAKPLPLPVWDRQRGTLVQEWMDDHQPHYESEPQRSFTQWVKSQPVYDRLYALYQNSRLSSREIEPLIRKYQIDMAEFEPVRYRSFAEFFDRAIPSGRPTMSADTRRNGAWETVSQPLAHSDSVLCPTESAHGIYLIHKVGRGMRAQGEGRILITGSIAGFMPGSYQAVYNGTKAFLDSSPTR